jgi:hypothetical protein
MLPVFCVCVEEKWDAAHKEREFSFQTEIDSYIECVVCNMEQSKTRAGRIMIFMA